MQDLTLVGLTEDKLKLVLVSDSGEEYTLAADARLRSALRGDHARLGQLEIQMESALRPRDIQARIRAGESPETVAAAAQTTVDRIMGYATPVLAERAHIADRAQRSSVRRKGGEGPARLLGDAVEERLRSRNVDPDAVEWDAWRREDGKWTLVADYRSGESSRHAEFLYDVPGRYVVAQDDEARWLVGEQSARKGPQPRAAGNTRRLTAVSAEEELPLGEDAIDLVSDPADLDASADLPAEEETVDLTEAAARVRRQPGQDTDLPVETGDADWMATQATERPRTVPVQDDPTGGDPAEEPVDAARHEAPADPDAEVESGSGDEDSTDQREEKPAPQKRPAKKTRGRASVPSWDEIMFGGGRSE